MPKPRMGVSMAWPKAGISGVVRFQERYGRLLSAAGVDVVPFHFTGEPGPTGRAYDRDRQGRHLFHVPRKRMWLRAEADGLSCRDPRPELTETFLDFYRREALDAVHLIEWLPGGMALWDAAMAWDKRTAFTPTEHASVCSYGFLLNNCGSACAGPGDGAKCARCTHSLEPYPPARRLDEPWYSPRHRLFHRAVRVLPRPFRPTALWFLSEHLQHTGAAVGFDEARARIRSARRFLADPKIAVAYQCPTQWKAFERCLGIPLPAPLPLVVPTPPQLYPYTPKAVTRGTRPVSYLFAARASFDRGLWFLLDAWGRWRPQGNKARLVVYTERSDTWLEARAAGLRSQGCAVELHYERLDTQTMIAVHRHSHFVVDPAVWEEPGTASVVEGFYLGTPSIVPTDTGSADLVRDGIEGYHFRFCDAESLTETLEHSFDRMDEWDGLSAAAVGAGKRLDETIREHVRLLLQHLVPGFQPRPDDN